MTPVECDKLKAVYPLYTHYTLLLFYSVPLFGQGLRTLPLYPLPRGQERRPSVTPGTGPDPCGAASLHSHMESRGFRSPQKGPLLSAPRTVRRKMSVWIKGHKLYAVTRKAHLPVCSFETP